MPLQNLVDDVLRKIGRNMMLFQQLEYLLKFMVTYWSISGYSSELKDVITKKAETVSKQTMGQLVGQYIENTNPDYDSFSTEPAELKEIYHSFRFSVETDSESHAAKKEALANLVDERNELIHHLLPKFDTTSKLSCEELSIKLDQQSEVIRREIKEVQSFVEALNDSRKELDNYLTSDLGIQDLKRNFLRQTGLAIILVDIADQLGKDDGWVSLSLAGQLVREHMPEELARLRENYNHKTLKGFMLATKMFELSDEETSKGGVRLVYRLKSDADAVGE